jgi:gas vesicle protein
MKNDILERFFNVLPFERKSSTDWILPTALGLGVGMAAGVGIGMLLAPRSGAETRERLREGAETLKGRALNEAEHLKDRARDLADKAKGQLTHATQQLGNGLASHHSSELTQGR